MTAPGDEITPASDLYSFNDMTISFCGPRRLDAPMAPSPMAPLLPRGVIVTRFCDYFSRRWSVVACPFSRDVRFHGISFNHLVHLSARVHVNADLFPIVVLDRVLLLRPSA